MSRRRLLWLTMFTLAGVLAATRLPSRPVSNHAPTPRVVSPGVPAGSFAVVPRQPLLEAEKAVDSQLIPTEVPDDCVRLLPNFTPPAEIRLLADARRARRVTLSWSRNGQ